ncbi:MAG: cation-translocating P-type ATPase [Candidatus Bathyarchaeota archaeon]|nr:cation-translocating P-type ATPase [Candidatus Termiticorpusculum sp.]
MGISKAVPEKPETEVIGEEEQHKKVLTVFAVWLVSTIVITGIIDYFFDGIPIGFDLPLLNISVTVSLILYYVSILTSAIYIGVVGLKELVIERRFSVEFLMAVAGLGALYLDYRFEAATVLMLYCIAEYFEGYIQDRARKTVEKLSTFMPEIAHVIYENQVKDVFVNSVAPGAVLLVRPGERIPLDGDVVEGFSHVDQALVTGESIPVPKKAPDSVYAGTLNQTGVLKINVTKKASETLISRIVLLVIESGKHKASIERLVDRFARFYVPIVIGLAIFTAAGLPLIIGGSFNTWFYRSLILLVVSCPSAFIISVPATIFVAITVAAKRGVIVKGGVFVEKLAQIKCVIFDKTGTLTLGRPAIHKIHRVDNAKAEGESLAYAAALDQYSNHPIAQAITRQALARGIDLTKFKVEDVIEVPGKGIVGQVNGKHVAVGNFELMQEFGCDCTEAFEITAGDIHTAVCISVGKSGLAAVCVTDEVREDALRAIRSLKKGNIKTAMLTGDKKEIAKETAQALGIDEVHAELFPEDKLRLVQQLKHESTGLVAMVGDGVNDAPALAVSDVGIAMGVKGVDIALESADVVLVNDELSQISYLIKLSQKAMVVAKQNIAASLAIKLVLGGLGMLGLIPLWFTVAAGDDGITMLLLLNTLRLERVKP